MSDCFRPSDDTKSATVAAGGQAAFYRNSRRCWEDESPPKQNGKLGCGFFGRSRMMPPAAMVMIGNFQGRCVDRTAIEFAAHAKIR
jgi:hypothetical protein